MSGQNAKAEPKAETENRELRTENRELSIENPSPPPGDGLMPRFRGKDLCID